VKNSKSRVKKNLGMGRMYYRLLEFFDSSNVSFIQIQVIFKCSSNIQCFHSIGGRTEHKKLTTDSPAHRTESVLPVNFRSSKSVVTVAISYQR